MSEDIYGLDQVMDNLKYEYKYYNLLYNPIPNDDIVEAYLAKTPGMTRVNNFIARVERSKRVKEGKISTALIAVGGKEIYKQIMASKVDVSEYSNLIAWAHLSDNIFVRDNIANIKFGIFHGKSVHVRMIKDAFYYLDSLAETIGIYKTSMLSVAYWTGYSVVCLENATYLELVKRNKDVHYDLSLSHDFLTKFIDFNVILTHLKHGGFLYDV